MPLGLHASMELSFMAGWTGVCQCLSVIISCPLHFTSLHSTCILVIATCSVCGLDYRAVLVPTQSSSGRSTTHLSFEECSHCSASELHWWAMTGWVPPHGLGPLCFQTHWSFIRIQPRCGTTSPSMTCTAAGCGSRLSLSRRYTSDMCGKSTHPSSEEAKTPIGEHAS